MVEGKTKSGFKFKINENILNDWDFVTLSDKLRRGNGSMEEANMLYEMVLGSDGMKKLKEHIREKNDGIVDAFAMRDEFTEIISSTKVKNSPSSPSV